MDSGYTHLDRTRPGVRAHLVPSAPGAATPGSLLPAALWRKLCAAAAESRAGQSPGSLSQVTPCASKERTTASMCTQFRGSSAFRVILPGQFSRAMTEVSGRSSLSSFGWRISRAARALVQNTKLFSPCWCLSGTARNGTDPISFPSPRCLGWGLPSQHQRF